MNKSETIDLVIPVYNGGRYLTETIESAMNIKAIGFKIWIFDNGSTDGEVELISKTPLFQDSRITIIRSEFTIPMDLSWTTATFLAEAEFMILLPADDLIINEGLQELVENTKRFPEVNMFIGKLQYINSRSKKIWFLPPTLRMQSGIVSSAELFTQILKSGRNLIGATPCVLFRTSALKEMMPWSSKRPYVTDLELYLRMLKTQKHIFIAKNISAAFRIHGGSLTRNIGMNQTSQVESLLNDYTSNSTISQIYIRKLQINFYRMIRIIVQLIEKYI